MPGNEREFGPPTGLNPRVVLLIACVVPVTTRLGEEFVQDRRRLDPFEGPPGCVQVWTRYFRTLTQSDRLTSDIALQASQVLNQHPECTTAPNPLPLSPPLFFLTVLALLTVLQVVLGPVARIRLRGLVRLRAADPELDRLLRESRAVAGVRVRFLLDPLDPQAGGTAFGYPGRRYVVLNRGLIALAREDPDAFRAIVLHELAHVRNRDIDLTAVTQAIWRSFLFGVLIPAGLLFLFADLVVVHEPWLTALQLVLLAVMVSLLRSSVLRAREHFADLRALGWSASSAGLTRALEDDTGAHRRPLDRLFRLHPSPAQRRAAVASGAPPWFSDHRDLLALGVAVGLAWPSALQQVTLLPKFGADATRAGWHLALIAMLSGLVLASAVWRTVWSGRHGALPRRETLLGLAFAGGLVLGTWLTPARSDLALFPTPVDWHWELLWDGVLVLGCWASAACMGLTARAWAGIRSPAFGTAVAVAGMTLTTALFTSWSTPLLRSRLDLSSWLQAPPAVAFAPGSPILGELTRWITPSWSWSPGFHWPALLISVCFAALGLLHAAFRGRRP
ncbi:M48 family metallopeptidase [Amycolatopsis sp. NPDC057786]|uniref:M48 family metallopeptidase n=1 Tax=Amycolatopsis sp. NPDC057786 TaxID=3346250 RepID=UPI0036720C33